VFLGYAAGVGKTYQMLTEAHDLERRGVDVVIGYFEPHGRKETIALSEELEAVPRMVLGWGSAFEEMDTDAILSGALRWRSSTSSRTRMCRALEAQTLGRCSRSARCRHRRPDDDERAAPGS
jgi:hypothetical protein